MTLLPKTIQVTLCGIYVGILIAMPWNENTDSFYNAALVGWALVAMKSGLELLDEIYKEEKEEE